ncbi:STM4015 family protein [Nocardiopsis sp. NPDC049922]|uniref:STM4015 family protein n=1 Tax=Nocardiopsis sp. NPDC049922 TaxID=3155157 RepID=UPI00340CEDC2
MPNSDHITEFAGLPVVEFTSWEAIRGEFTTAMRWARNRNRPHATLPPSYRPLFEAIAAPKSVAWRLRTELPPYRSSHYRHEESWEDLDAYLERFTDLVPPESVRALIVGNISDDDDYQFRSEEARDRIVALAPTLTNLRALFFGEVLQSEQEISWIEHCDLAPLLTALPQLTEFTVRGGSGPLGLRLDDGHSSLRRFTVQSGGLRPEVVRDVCASPMPELEHLELWLGAEEYEGVSTPDDLAPVLTGEAFPKLRSLGLRNSDATGTWVRALADAPVTARLETLDLSLGTLRDEDVDALLDAPAFRNLKRLDLHHHYLSEDNVGRVRAAFTEAGVEVDLSDPQEPDDWGDEFQYYPAVAE